MYAYSSTRRGVGDAYVCLTLVKRKGEININKLVRTILITIHNDN